MPTSSLKTKLRAWAATQWERIPPVPHAHAGSYDRGYQNGLADVLRGVQTVLESSGDETSVMLPDGPAPFRPTDEVIRRVCLGGMRTTEEGREIITYLRWLERRQAVEVARRTDTRLAGDIDYCLAKINPATDVHAILTEVMKDLRSPEEPTARKATYRDIFPDDPTWWKEGMKGPWFELPSRLPEKASGLCVACGHHDQYHFDDGKGNVVCRWSETCVCIHRTESIRPENGPGEQA